MKCYSLVSPSSSSKTRIETLLSGSHAAETAPSSAVTNVAEVFSSRQASTSSALAPSAARLRSLGRDDASGERPGPLHTHAHREIGTSPHAVVAPVRTPRRPSTGPYPRSPCKALAKQRGRTAAKPATQREAGSRLATRFRHPWRLAAKRSAPFTRGRSLVRSQVRPSRKGAAQRRLWLQSVRRRGEAAAGRWKASGKRVPRRSRDRAPNEVHARIYPKGAAPLCVSRPAGDPPAARGALRVATGPSKLSSRRDRCASVTSV